MQGKKRAEKKVDVLEKISVLKQESLGDIQKSVGKVGNPYQRRRLQDQKAEDEKEKKKKESSQANMSKGRGDQNTGGDIAKECRKVTRMSSLMQSIRETSASPEELQRTSRSGT